MLQHSSPQPFQTRLIENFRYRWVRCECAGEKCPLYNGGKADCYGYIGCARQAFGAGFDYGKEKEGSLKKRVPAHISASGPSLGVRKQALDHPTYKVPK